MLFSHFGAKFERFGVPKWRPKSHFSPRTLGIVGFFGGLENGVVPKARLGGSRGRFWSLPRSILEPPGVDLEDFGGDFSKICGVQVESDFHDIASLVQLWLETGMLTFPHLFSSLQRSLECPTRERAFPSTKRP